MENSRKELEIFAVCFIIGFVSVSIGVHIGGLLGIIIGTLGMFCTPVYLYLIEK